MSAFVVSISGCGAGDSRGATDSDVSVTQPSSSDRDDIVAEAPGQIPAQASAPKIVVQTTPATSGIPSRAGLADAAAEASTAESHTTDLSDTHIVVLGNSVDRVAGIREDGDGDVWPDLMKAILGRDPELANLTVQNEARPGATMATVNTWGSESHFRMVTHVPEVFKGFDEVQLGRTVVILAPSVIDLQLNGGDVEAAVLALHEVVDVLDPLGLKRIIVLPMNPLSSVPLPALGIENVTALNRDIAEFNSAIVRQALTPPGYSVSPLLEAGSNNGEPRYYDDFRSTNLQGDTTGSDGLHLDREGHMRIATAVSDLLLHTIFEMPVGDS